MCQVLPIRTRDAIVNSGPEWVFGLLANRADNDRAMNIMLLWRIWSLPNELTHSKDAHLLIAPNCS